VANYNFKHIFYQFLVIVSKNLKDDTMAKRKKIKSPANRKSVVQKNSKVLTYIVWGLSIIALLLIGMILGYYFGYSNSQNNLKNKLNQTQEKYLSQNQSLEKKLLNERREKATLEERLKGILNKKIKEYTSASHELDTKETKIPKPHHPKVKKTKKSHAKLAIIIDDVMTKYQVRAIKSLHIPITMSFLPPSKARPNSAKLARKEKFYMVHLPMEAMHFTAEEPLTLRTTDTKADIKKRIDQLQKLFPRVRYINNHTGSKFTSNEQSMRYLLNILKDKKIHFIDSRTTAKTKAPKIMKELGLPYIARDVFLDHKQTKQYIKSEIKRAIKIAKKTGWAIAIGHPHKNTLQALAESKQLLKSVELVYINKIP
jgi:hypothetical protein